MPQPRSSSLQSFHPLGIVERQCKPRRSPSSFLLEDETNNGAAVDTTVVHSTFHRLLQYTTNTKERDRGRGLYRTSIDDPHSAKSLSHYRVEVKSNEAFLSFHPLHPRYAPRLLQLPANSNLSPTRPPSSYSCCRKLLRGRQPSKLDVRSMHGHRCEASRVILANPIARCSFSMPAPDATPFLTHQQNMCSLWFGQ